MATAVKNLRTITAAGTSNGAGSTTTGTAVNLTTAFGGVVTAKVTNGATGPTVGCSVLFDISGDNANWKNVNTVVAAIGNNVVSEYTWEVPAGVMYVRVKFTGNTFQAVTVEAFLQELTSFG